MDPALGLNIVYLKRVQWCEKTFTVKKALLFTKHEPLPGAVATIPGSTHRSRKNRTTCR